MHNAVFQLHEGISGPAVVLAPEKQTGSLGACPCTGLRIVMGPQAQGTRGAERPPGYNTDCLMF